MIYNKLVEIGRVVFIAKGKDEGKLATIVNIVDGTKALLDGPCTGVSRCVRNFKDLELTKFKLPIRVGQRTKKVKAAYEADDVNAKWGKTSWARKLEKKRLRSSLTDFERFKVMKAKQLRNRLINTELGKMKKSSK